MRKLFITFITILICSVAAAQNHTASAKPLPTLSVEGRWLVDKHGNHVVLHGVMDTPNMYFNGWRWGDPWSATNYSNYNTNSVPKCLDYFEKLFAGMEEAKCDVFRLHLDPAWTNDPSSGYVYSGSKGQSKDATGEADISKFNPSRLTTFLTSLYWPLIQKAMDHGMYVVVRPPGVCPQSLKVGDYYNEYLKTVWDIFSSNENVRKYAGQVSIELANEPVSLKNANGQDDPKALHDFFQPIVDKIRANGFTGIIWAPGTTWQQNYTGYAAYPIEGENIGYAVHDYCGWYGCSDDSPSPDNKIEQFRRSVPVVDTAPVIITEVDWSPENPDAEGHKDEQGKWVKPNYGTWATGSTSKWGKAYKTMLDHFGNISMTLSGTGCLFDIDKLLESGTVVPAFGGLKEACGYACMEWYKDYFETDWAHADDEVESGDAYTPVNLSASADVFQLLIGEEQRLSLKVNYLDWHTKDVGETATYSVDNPAVACITNSYIQALAAGQTDVTATYTDRHGQQVQSVFSVRVTGVSTDDFSSLSSLSEISDTPFMIMSNESQSAFYGSDNQNLGFASASQIINRKDIVGYKFKAEPVSGRSGCYLLRLTTLQGGLYSIWGSPGYLNSQPAQQNCCFILGLNNQYGQDIKDGAVWEIKHEEGKGFTLKNMGTGLYLKDNGPARYESPSYFSFCVQNPTAIQTIRQHTDISPVYNLQGLKVGMSDDTTGLPRGIYIIGNRKVIIR